MAPTARTRQFAGTIDEIVATEPLSGEASVSMTANWIEPPSRRLRRTNESVAIQAFDPFDSIATKPKGTLIASAVWPLIVSEPGASDSDRVRRRARAALVNDQEPLADRETRRRGERDGLAAESAV